MNEKKRSDHFVILFFSILTLIFNVYLICLKCIPKVPDKILLSLTLIITLMFVILIPIKVVNIDKKTKKYVKDLLDIAHWGYLIVIPLSLLLARSVPLIILMICVSWFALIGRAIYDECPLTSIAEKSTMLDTDERLVNLFFVICTIIGSVRLLIN